MTDPATQFHKPECTKMNAYPVDGQHCCCGWVTPAGHGVGVLRGVIVTVIMIIILSARRPRTAHRIMLLACFSQILREHVRRFLQGAIWQHWCCWGLAPPVHGPGPSHGAERALH